MESPIGEKMENLLKHLRKVATLPLVMHEEHQEAYFENVKENVFPAFSVAAKLVTQKGEAAPLFSDKKTFHTLSVVDDDAIKGYLSVGIHALNEPTPFSIKGNVVGNETSILYVFDGTNSVSFHSLDNGDIVFVNDNQDDSERLLDSSQALFDKALSHKLYPIGNPAAWINKILERKMLQKLHEELSGIIR